MANQTESHENQHGFAFRDDVSKDKRCFGLLCFRRCSNMNKKPINASKISENPIHTNSYQRIKYEGNSFVEESL